MAWLPDGEINLEDIFIRFGATHERDRRTDGHRMPAIAALMHSIARQNGQYLPKLCSNVKGSSFLTHSVQPVGHVYTHSGCMMCLNISYVSAIMLHC